MIQKVCIDQISLAEKRVNPSYTQNRKEYVIRRKITKFGDLP